MGSSYQEPEFLQRVFGPTGLFSQAFPAYELRAGQLEIARAVSYVQTVGRHLLAEGPCGIGKSFAYLVPSIAHAVAGRISRNDNPDPVVVATANISLQEQLVGKDLPTLQRVLQGWQFRFALLKGRSNYLCRRKVLLVTPAQRPRDQEAREQLQDILDWQADTRAGDQSELPFLPLPYVWSLVSSSADECHGDRCDQQETCWANLARRAAREADVVVTNYHQLLAHVRLRMETGRDLLLPPFRRLVLDEAHELAPIARDFWGWQVSEWTLRRLSRWAMDVGGRPKLGERLQESSRLYFQALAEYALGGQYRRRLRRPGEGPTPEQVVRALQELQAYLEAYKDQPDLDDQEVGEAQAILRQTEAAAYRLQDLWEANSPDFVYYLEVEDRRGQKVVRACAKLLEPGPVLQGALFGRAQSVVLCSATLTTSGTFEFVRQQSGAPAGEATLELAVASPFNHQRQAILVLPPLPDSRDPAYLEQAGDALLDVLSILDGRTLVLCTSYRVARALTDRVRASRPPWRVMQQGEMPRLQLAQIFREDERSVLIGCESFWTGLDVPGPACSCVVVDKLPFPHVDDPVVDAINETNPRAFHEFMTPTAILLFRQGVGRLIRRADDVGAVVVLDPRLLTKGYGAQFLNSLPAMYQSQDVQEIRQFLRWAGRPVGEENRQPGEEQAQQQQQQTSLFPPALPEAKVEKQALGNDDIPF
ncbi:MAG: ATP-dependent DNA helicase [Lentisphaeria bacterium]